MKALLIGGVLFAPAAALWLRSSPASAADALQGQVSQAAQTVMRVPVEVLAEGKAAEWVYVEVPVQSVPEPGLVSLLALAVVALALRRSRA
jgi:hypothetical protein